jgi:hypothetical protein
MATAANPVNNIGLRLKENNTAVLNARYKRLREANRLYPAWIHKTGGSKGGQIVGVYDSKAVLGAIDDGGKTPEIGNTLLTPSQMLDLSLTFKKRIENAVNTGDYVFFVLDETRTVVKDLLILDVANGPDLGTPLMECWRWNDRTLRFG